MTRTVVVVVLSLAIGFVTPAKADAPKADAPKAGAPAEPSRADASKNRHEISITRKGFAPDRLTVKKGESVTLAFTRTTDATCAKTVVVQLGDGKKVEKEIPLDQTVEIAATFAKTGELTYACSMDMVRGVVLVQ